MGQFFLRILNISLNASWLIVAVILLRLLFGHKVHKWVYCVLWMLIGIRLVIPFSLESRLSLLPEVEVTMGEQRDVGDQSESIMSQNTGEGPISNSNPSVVDNSTVLGILAVVWIIGAAALIGYSLIGMLRLKLRLKTATLYQKGVKQSEWIRQPFVVGIFKPVIYIPYKTDEKEMEYIIDHETAHIRRLDPLWKTLGSFTLALHWFNPLVWLSYFLFGSDIEMACDERVIKRKDDAYRKAYSSALINATVGHKVISVGSAYFGETEVKKRIINIVNYKSTVSLTVVVLLLGFILTGCLATTPVDKKTAEQVAKDSIVRFLGNSENGEFYYENYERLDLADPYIIYIPENDTQDEIYIYPVYDTETKKLLYQVEVFSGKSKEYTCSFGFADDVLNELNYLERANDILIYRIGRVVYFELDGKIYNGAGVEIVSTIDGTEKEKEFLALFREGKKAAIQKRKAEFK